MAKTLHLTDDQENLLRTFLEKTLKLGLARFKTDKAASLYNSLLVQFDSDMLAQANGAPVYIEGASA